MKKPGVRWTGAILASMAGLTIASFFLHAGSREERPAAPRPVLAAKYGAPTGPDPTPAPSPAEQPPAPAAAVPALSVEHRPATAEGYREAREATWEGAVSGQVLSSEGPLANFTVQAEWLLELKPDRDEAARLKRAGARRDRDGAWWARALAETDESGCFRFEGLPAVPVRLRAGSVTQQVQVGGFAQLRTERP
jgi:hypothetical protein